MRALRQLLATVIVLAALGAGAATALGSGIDVIRDCTDDEVMSKTYSQKEYRDALRELAADADQYGNCRDVIRRAQQAALAAARDRDDDDAAGAGGGKDGGAGAIGSAPAGEQLAGATDAERAAVESARTTDAGPVEIGSVDTTAVGTAPGLSQASDLPAPIVVLLALLLAGALVLGGLRFRSLVNARRA